MTTAVRIYETTDIEGASTNSKCTHMDRQRVVHFAKSRTAKVIRPGSTNRQSPSATITSELPPAPLASIDSDFVVITKRRDETNMAPNVWDQLRKSMPQTNFSVHAIDGESGLFDRGCLYNEQNGFARPRTYVKLRSAQNLDWQTECSDHREDLQPPGVRSRPLQVHSVVTSGQSRIPSEDKSVPAYLLQTQTLRQRETKCSTDFSISHKQNVELQDKSRNVNQIKGHTCINTKQTVASRELPQVGHAHRNSQSQAPVLNVLQQINISDQTSHNSTLRLPSSPYIKSRHDCLQETNSADWSSNYVVIPQKVASPTSPSNTSRQYIPEQDCTGPRVAAEQSTFQRDTKGSHNSEMETPYSVTIPEGMVHLNRLESVEEPLPELYGISSSVYTSNIRLASERIARALTGHIGDNKDNMSYHVGHVNTQSCSGVHDERGEPQSCPRQDQSNIQPLQNVDLPTVRAVNQSDKYTNGGGEHNRGLPITSNNSSSVSGPELCSKRASSKPATHGYSCIQDLVSSVDYLTIHTHNLTNVEDTPSFIGSSTNCEKLDSDRSSQINFSDGRKLIHVQTEISENESLEDCKNMKEDIFTDTSNSKKLQQSQDNVGGETDLKQLSFRLAPTGISDVWLVERNVCDRSNTSREKWFSVESNKSGVNDMTWGHIDMENLTDQTSAKNREQHSDGAVSYSTHQHNSNLDKQIFQEKFRTLKRHSFMLATCSLSDLTFPDDDTKCDYHFHRHNSKICGQQDFRDFHEESSSSSIFMTPDSQSRRRINDSFSSDQHNSSFGSFYSCQSQNSGKAHPTEGVSMNKDKTQFKRNQGHRYSSFTSRQNVLEHSMDSDSSCSGDASAYYTASDTSFPKSGGTFSSAQCMNHASQRSPRPLLPTQWRGSHNNHQQKRLQSKADPHSLFRNANTLPHGVRPSKQAYPKRFLQCYSCGLDDGLSVKTYLPGRRNNSRGVSNRSRIWVNPDYLQRRPRQERKRSRSMPATKGTQSRRCESSSTHSLSAHTHAHAEPHGPPSNQSCGSVRDCSISGSLNSLMLDSTWETLPRIPPSLGRPRRKLYAGFDSQPLPMDSFLSDSSSVYSTQSCSSWGTSKSAVVEGTSRTLDMSSTTRSVSSINSIITTPTRQDDVFDFFTYSGKRSSMCENSYNLYLGSGKAFTDQCFKEGFYDKNCSKDSLESVLSNGTTVNLEYMLNLDTSLDELKPGYNSAPDSNDFHNTDDLPTRGSQYDRNNLNRINNDCVGSRLYKNCNGVMSANSNNQQQTLKGSSTAAIIKTNVLSKRKYFSTRDILDLVMASEQKYCGSKRRSRSLERQAQKMCEVILCLN